MRQHYFQIQRLLARSDLPAAERAQLERERDFAVRLMCYSSVRTMFQRVYGRDAAAAFAELGLAAPDFAALSRKAALEKIAAFEVKLSSTPSASASTRALGARMRGAIVELSTAHVPPGWVF